MKRAALFDFDMTLIDSSHGVTFCLNRVADAFGLKAVKRDEVIRTIGYPMENAMEMLWGSFSGSWLEYYRDKLVPLEHERLVSFPGVEKTLKLLAARGVAMAVVSNRKRLRPAVAGAGLEGYFLHLVGMDDVDMPKPHPQPLHIALERLGESSGRAVFVGDSEVDARAAKAAGVDFIGLTSGGRSRPDLIAEGALAVVDHFPDILPMILEEGPEEENPYQGGVI